MQKPPNGVKHQNAQLHPHVIRVELADKKSKFIFSRVFTGVVKSVQRLEQEDDI